MAGTKKTTTEATPLTGEQLSAKAAELKAAEDKLAQDTKAFEDAKATHETEVEKFDTDKKEFDDAKATHDANVEEFKKQKVEFEAAQKEAGKKDKPAKAEKPHKGLDFTLFEDNYKFKDSAPKNILFNGKAWTQKELVEDEEALIQLVSTNIYTEKI